MSDQMMVLIKVCSIHKVEIISLAFVVFNLLPDLAVLDPTDVVLHVPVDVKGRVGDCLNSHLDVALLDVHDCFLDSLGHLESLHDHGQPPPAHGSHVDLLTFLKPLSLLDQAHLMELVDQLLGLGDPVGVALLECHEFGHNLLDLTNDFVVLLIVVSVLNVVPPEHVHLTDITIFFPVQEVGVFQKLLLVILKLSHCHFD